MTVRDMKSDKKKRGRPSTGFDKRAYMKEYMRNRRASKANSSRTISKGEDR